MRHGGPPRWSSSPLDTPKFYGGALPDCFARCARSSEHRGTDTCGPGRGSSLALPVCGTGCGRSSQERAAFGTQCDRALYNKRNEIDRRTVYSTGCRASVASSPVSRSSKCASSPSSAVRTSMKFRTQCEDAVDLHPLLLHIYAAKERIPKTQAQESVVQLKSHSATGSSPRASNRN